MQKTRLGISVGLISAIMFFLGAFGVYAPVIILICYVIFFEQDEWLRRNAIFTAVVMVVVYVAAAILHLVPNSRYVFDFSDGFHIGYLVNIIVRVLYDIETLLFLLLGLIALKHKSISSDSKVCPSCGTQLEENIKFCIKCGAKVDD